MKTLRTIAACALAILSTSAIAGKSLGKAGGYDIDISEPTRNEPEQGYCAASTDFQGPGNTKFTLLHRLKRPETVYITIQNTNWSIKQDDKIDATVNVNGKTFGGPAFGTKTDKHKGFVIGLDYDEFMPNFAAGNRILFQRADGRLIDQLSLNGSAAAKKAMDSCWTRLQTKAPPSQRRRDRPKTIPVDPFAKK